jgi:hypothetical protein
VIRFSASLVVVGVGLLVAGSVTSKLLLIYIAIGVSAVALLFLIIGAFLNRSELLGREPEGVAGGETESSEHTSERDETPEPAATAVAAAGAGAGSGWGLSPERGESAGYSAPPTPPDRPRETQVARGGRGAGEDFPGYERFTGDGERRQPAKQSFNDPQPTRMDLSAADIREAGRQEQERSGRDRGQDRDRSQDRADRTRAERQPAGQPFTDPEPTRMDLSTADIREREQQERTQRGQDRPAQERRDRDRPERQPAGKPFTDPEPTRMDLSTADIREREQQEQRDAPARPSGDRESGHTDQPAPTRPEPTRPEPTRPAPTQPGPVRPDKLLVGRSGSNTLDNPAGPAESRGSSGQTAPDQTGGADPGDTDRASASSGGGATDVSATREQEALSPSTPPAVSQPAAKDNPGGSGPGKAEPVPPGTDVTVVPGVPRYHRSDCILIRFMGDGDLQRMSVRQAREAGCTPCRACQPDGEVDEDDE